MVIITHINMCKVPTETKLNFNSLQSLCNNIMLLYSIAISILKYYTFFLLLPKEIIRIVSN